jgi:glutathione S-transferase
MSGKIAEAVGAETVRELSTDSHWISPWVFTVFVALKEKGLPFTTATVALESKAQLEPAYRDGTITGRVPALRDGDFWLAESTAIVDYLEEAYPDTPRLLPVDVRQRARARQLLGWLRSDLGALREARPTTSMFYERAKDPMPPAARQAADKLLHVCSLLLPKGGTSLFGPWCIADADLAMVLNRLTLNGEDVPSGVRAFAEHQWARPSVRAFVEHPRPAAYAPY